MQTCRLLYLTAQQLLAFRWHAGHFDEREIFVAGEPGARRFEAYLAAHTDEVYVLLVNIADEGFAIETIPFLRGADRNAVITRRLAQTFFNAPFTATLTLGYEKATRRNERLLLAALTDTTDLAVWLDALSRARVPLAGLHSLPLLAPALLKMLDITDRQCLLLTQQDQSIRQTYVENENVHFSRLAALHNDQPDGIAKAFFNETVRLRQYLSSQRLLARNQPITAYLIATAEAGPAIRELCINSDALRFIILDLDECARKTGLESVPRECLGEAVFLHLAATHPPRVQFGDDTLRHDYHLKLIRGALYSIGSATLIATLASTGLLISETITISQHTAALQQETAALRRRHDEIVRTFSPIPISNDDLRQVMDGYQRLEKQRSTPDRLFVEISKALKDAPAIEIDSIDWSTEPDPRRAQPASDSTTALPPADTESALVRGRLYISRASSLPEVIDRFDQFVAALRDNPALAVRVLVRPIDLDADSPLRDADVVIEGVATRPFTLRLSRKTGS